MVAGTVSCSRARHRDWHSTSTRTSAAEQLIGLITIRVSVRAAEQPGAFDIERR